MGVFIDPSTDWGFKKIFGDAELLISFLNSLLEGEHVITSVEYMNNERVPKQKDERKVIYDLYCETDTGEHIIVEMQKRRRNISRTEPCIIPPAPLPSRANRGIGTTS